MKIISNILFVLWGMCGCLSGQDGQSQIGFIRLVQAVVPGAGKVNVRIDGEDMFPKGYDLGQCTGGMGFHAGEHRIEVMKSGVLRTTVRISLSAGETVTLVAYAERRDPPEGMEGGGRWKMMVLRLRQRAPGPGRQLTMLSVSSRENIPVRAKMADGRNHDISWVRRVDPVSIPLGGASGDMLELFSNEIPLGTISLDEAGNYVVILYDKEDGGLGIVSFYDPKLVIAG